MPHTVSKHDSYYYGNISHTPIHTSVDYATAAHAEHVLRASTPELQGYSIAVKESSPY